jgi:apolipoprotein N-acyltransferase
MQQTGFLPVQLPPALPLPFYARAGLWLPGGAAILLIIVGLASGTVRRRVSHPKIHTV